MCKFAVHGLIFILLLIPFSLKAESDRMLMNGFVLSEPLIPIEEVYHGGPPRDGIPSLDKPHFVSVEENQFLKGGDRVLGVSFSGIRRAYPIGILNHHEIVNDLYAETPVVISFCPLCGTGMAFQSVVKGRHLQFGVSGLLYNSDVLMYDRQTNSLWSQVQSRAVNGKLKGQVLTAVPLEHTTWEVWRKRFPNTQVLSHDTGYARNYNSTPYSGYSDSSSIYFPVAHSDKRYHPKEVVVGIVAGQVKKAYPFVELSKYGKPVQDTVGGKDLVIDFDPKAHSVRVTDKKGKITHSLTAFWFAWYAFYPETELFTAK